LIDLFCFIEDLPNEAFESGIPWNWETWPEYAKAAAQHPTAVNAAPLVGHTPIRVWVMGEEAWERSATEAEVAAMEDALRQALGAGAFGMASAAMDLDRANRPVPCRLGDEEERRSLFRVLAGESRVAMHAVRLMEPEYFESDVEALGEDVRATGVRALWAALMSTPGDEEQRRSILELHRRQRAEGLDIWSQTPGRPQFGAINFERSILFQGIDAWHEMVNEPEEPKMAMLRDPAWRARAREDWDRAEFCMFPIHSLEVLTVGHCAPHNESFRGMTLDKLIELKGGGHPSDVFADWLLDNGTVGTGFASTAPPNRNLEGVAELLREPYILSGASDAGAHIQIMCSAGEATYVLTEHVRDAGRLAIEEAVHLFTQQQAGFWGIRDRGVIAPGYAADLTVFDLAALRHPEDEVVHDLPCATWRYTKSPAGYRATVVNGVPTWLEGGSTGARPGGFLDPRARAAVRG